MALLSRKGAKITTGQVAEQYDSLNPQSV